MKWIASNKVMCEYANELGLILCSETGLSAAGHRAEPVFDLGEPYRSLELYP